MQCTVCILHIYEVFQTDVRRNSTSDFVIETMRMMLSKFDSNCLSKPTFELFRPISYLYTWYYQVGRPLVVLELGVLFHHENYCVYL